MNNDESIEFTFEPEILDFNEAHKTRLSQQKDQQRFSITQVKRVLKLDDIDRWIRSIIFPNSKLYTYPSSLEKASIHQQSCYIQPQLNFLINTKEQECECCGNKIRRKRYSIWSSDMYEIIGKEYGLCIPLYFTIIKLHIITLLFLGIMFGAYFCYLSYSYCETDPEYENCAYYKSEFLVNQAVLLNELPNDSRQFYLWLSYATYFIIQLTPFIHEIIIKTRLVQYWNYDIYNHRKPSELTLYIKHLPKKFSEQEILVYILTALQHNQMEQPVNHCYIEELVYIYDTHPINELNQLRTQTYLQLLQNVQHLKDDPKNMEIKGVLIDNILELMRQTKQIQTFLKDGLNFTSKVLIKFSDKKITNKVVNFYSKNLVESIKANFQLFGNTQEELRKINEQQHKLEMMISQTDNSPQTSFLKTPHDIRDLAKSKSIEMDSTINNKTRKQQLAHSLAEFIEYDVDNQISPNLKRQNSQEIKKKGLHIQRGFSQDDIFWENMGMSTLKRLILRIETTTVTIIAGLVSMAIFLYLFSKEQKIKNTDNSKTGFTVWEQDLLVIILILCIVFMSIVATIIVIKMTVRAKRSAYSLQEKNIIVFMNPIQQVCIISFPYIVTLSIDKFNVLNNALICHILFFLGIVRLGVKALINVFHLRAIGFRARRQKILKTFQPHLYFQKQLNNLMTPNKFPIRSRMFYSFYIFSTGILMMFIGPFILVVCIILLIFFYYFDKYVILNVYTIDKQFNYHMINYLVISYQVVMIPIYTFVYMFIYGTPYDEFYTSEVDVVFWRWLGFATGLVSFVLYITVRKKIALFWIFKIRRLQKQVKNPYQFHEKSYFKSYSDYYDGLGVEELNQLLIQTFKKMQYN